LGKWVGPGDRNKKMYDNLRAVPMKEEKKEIEILAPQSSTMHKTVMERLKFFGYDAFGNLAYAHI